MYRLVFALLCISFGSMAQSAVIEGKIVHKKDSAGFAGVYITLRQNNQVIKEAISDINGKYVISTIPEGSYDLRFKFVGKRKIVVKNISLPAEETRKFDLVYPHL